LTLSFLILLAVKIGATASIVVLASVAVERVGPLIGGIIIGLPITAGPGYVFLAMSADSSFVAESALMSFQAVLAIFAFQATFVLLSTRLGALGVVTSSLGAWLAAAVIIERADLGLLPAIAAVLGAYGICIPLAARGLAADVPRQGHASRRELLLRALLAGLLVAVVVSGNEIVGAQVTGIGLVFPTTLLAMAWIMRRRHGGRAASAVMAAAMLAVPGFAASALSLHLLAQPLGSWMAMLLALSVSIAISVFFIAIRGRVHAILTRPA
jgi:hypothetical protein